MATPELLVAPLTVAVYVVPYAKEELGVKVAVSVEELYESVAATVVPAEFLSVKPSARSERPR